MSQNLMELKANSASIQKYLADGTVDSISLLLKSS